MMKKLIIFLMFFVLCFSVQGEQWIYNTKQIEVGVEITSGLEIIPEKSDYVIEEVGTQLYIFPREYDHQKLLKIDIDPEAEILNDSLSFFWDDINQNKFEFSIFGELILEEALTKVKRKINFPIQNIDEKLIKYIEPQDKIDSNNEEIISLASHLAEGESDLFVVVFNIASWVEENIDYDLNSLTEKLSQKASWVLDNKYGVCDELTSLFIAMVRSLGIPARYVSGFAYTDWNDLNDFGSHAWAEVYFPGEGWVAFDLTYHEFGYTDVGHVKLMQGLDAGESSIKFNVLGHGVKIEANELLIDVNLNEKSGDTPSKINLDVDIFEEEVDFGSYNLIKVNIENLEDYYVSSTIHISNTTKLEVIGEKKQSVLLSPKDKKEIYWVIKVEDNLNAGYYYELPVEVYTREGERKGVNFTSKEGADTFSFFDVNVIVEESKEEERKTYSKKIELSCKSDEYTYVGENLNVACEIKNNGNVYLKEINICLDECVMLDLGISQKKLVEFNVLAKNGLKIKAQNEDVYKVVYIETDILDIPSLEIMNLFVPEKVKYEDIFSIKFRLNKVSNSNPLEIDVNLERLIGEITLKELYQKQDISFKLNGKDLNEGNNTIKLKVEYKDKLGRKYLVEKNMIVELENVGFLQKGIILLKSINRFIKNIFI